MTGVPPAEPLTVFYDDACGLCRRLAEYGRHRSEGHLEFVAWQDFAAGGSAGRGSDDAGRAAPPARLRTYDGDQLLEDREAWDAILAAYPPFQSYAWIAERLGLMGTVSRVTYYGARWLRRGCVSCA